MCWFPKGAFLQVVERRAICSRVDVNMAVRSRFRCRIKEMVLFGLKRKRIAKPLMFSSALALPVMLVLALTEELFSKSVDARASRKQVPTAPVEKEHRLAMSIDSDDPPPCAPLCPPP